MSPSPIDLHMKPLPVTWRDLITEAMKQHGESWEDVKASAINAPDDLDKQFDDGYGATNGKPFTVWTTNRVYFPACYDGAEWVASVSRRPDKVATPHIGGC